MSISQTLRAEAAKRILIKDGPYGTGIQDEKLSADAYCAGLDLPKDQKGNNDLLNITQPQVVRSICERFAEAGAEILATNTFNANRISQADYAAEHLVGDINRSSARIIREVADRYSAKDGKPRWVAGALGPTNKTLSLSPDVNDPAFREVDFDTVKSVYREQIDALVEGGVDFILVETVFDTLNAKAAIMATLEARTGARPRASADGLDDPHRPCPDATCPATRSRPSGRRSATPSPSPSASTARSAPRSCARTWSRSTPSPTR